MANLHKLIKENKQCFYRGERISVLTGMSRRETKESKRYRNFQFFSKTFQILGNLPQSHEGT
jgi:hypothetical protein